MEEKFLAYKKLMRRKRLLLAIPLVLLILCGMAHELFGLPIFVFFIIMPIYLYISQYIFLALNNCPWCGLPFFMFGKFGLTGNGIQFVFQKKCLHCNKPTLKDIPNSHNYNN